MEGELTGDPTIYRCMADGEANHPLPSYSSGRKVFIGVPVYHGELFVAETLRSIQAQEHREFRVCISIDGHDAASEEACRPFLGDTRFELHVQPQRLGWAANLNWLMARCSGDFFCFWQQDDIAATSYLDKLVSHALLHPEAVCVYADLQWFGTRIDRVASPSSTGGALERVLRQIELGDYVPFLGLVRADALSLAGPVRLTPNESALEDQVWLARLAGLGPMHRVLDTLYFKRGHALEAHLEWETLPQDANRRRIWLEWGIGMLEAALVVSEVADHHKLFSIVVNRLTQKKDSRWLFYDALDQDSKDIASLCGEFAALVRERLGLEAAGEGMDGHVASQVSL